MKYEEWLGWREGYFKMKTYEDWYQENEEELHIRFAETGQDRELDFDAEDEIEKLYFKFCEDEEGQ